MPQSHPKRYLPDGSTRAVWSDALAARERAAGVIPHRGSRVEIIPEASPRQCQFHVDFSPLADATGDDRYRVCLVQTFDSYTAAVKAEVAWLTANWVLGDADANPATDRPRAGVGDPAALGAASQGQTNAPHVGAQPAV